MLVQKDEQIAKLQNTALQFILNPDQQQKLTTLQKEKQALETELHQSAEIQQQLARDKADLEKELQADKEKSALKAKALDEVEKGNYAEAEEHLRQSAKESIVETADTFYQLGKIKKLQLAYREAYDYFNLAIKINGANDAYLFEASDLADVLGYYDDEILLLEKIIGRTNATSKKMIACLNRLGGAMHEKGEYDKAISYYTRALTIINETYGVEDEQVACSYNGIGLAWGLKREYRTAIEYFEKALDISKKIYGETHTNIATCYNNIGVAWDNLGDRVEAIKYYNKALEIDKIFYNEDNEVIATRYNNIGAALYREGLHEKAIEYYEQALLILLKLLPPNHPYITGCQINIRNAQQALAAQQNSPNPPTSPAQ